jgi:hypothetical protein
VARCDYPARARRSRCSPTQEWLSSAKVEAVAEASTDFESCAKESDEIAAKNAYRDDGRIGIPKGGNMDCRMVVAGAWESIVS